MLSRSSALRTVTVLVIAALLLNTLGPVASAQDAGGNVYLPAVSGGQSAAVEDPVPPGRLPVDIRLAMACRGSIGAGLERLRLRAADKPAMRHIRRLLFENSAACSVNPASLAASS